jgi:hypothetical protein
MNKPTKSKFHIERQHWTKQQKVYKLHKMHYTPRQIADRMHYDQSFVNMWPEILAYLITKFDESVSPQVEGKRKHCKKVTITPKEIDLIELCAMSGDTHEDIAKRLGITVATLSHYRKENPRIDQAIEHGREDATRRVINALYRRATGMKMPKTIWAHFRGKFMDSKTVQENFPPNVEAALAWLVNNKNWVTHSAKDPGKPEGGDKGKIMKFIEQIAKD